MFHPFLWGYHSIVSAISQDWEVACKENYRFFYKFRILVGIGFTDDPTEKPTSMGDFSENVPFSETARQGCRALR